MRPQQPPEVQLLVPDLEVAILVIDLFTHDSDVVVLALALEYWMDFTILMIWLSLSRMMNMALLLDISLWMACRMTY